ncbi:MAG: LuxR C-terminal-related transcriptional regulator [Bryobacteraceae bacterium]|jgi:DNA-binding CsgD family transcriptional regulator
MRRWAIPAVALALPLCLIAELLPIRSYSTADGLAADGINRIVADSRGFVWFCTPEGLSRFDGYRFVNFGVAEGLPHRSVNALLETRSGEYLVGTPRGLSQFQAEGGGKFTTYLPGGNDPEENAVDASMQDSAGRIRCGTADGLLEMLSGHRFRRQRLPAPPRGHERISDLTAREPDVLRLIARGMRNKEIAAQLGIAEETTQGHVKNILSKLGLHDRTEAVAVAVRRGIVHID